MVSLEKHKVTEIVELFDKGLKVNEIADCLGLDRFLVGKKLKQEGRNGKQRWLSNGGTLEEVIKMYNEGATFTEISNKFKCSLTGIRDVLVKSGVINRGNFDIEGNQYNRKYTLQDDIFENIDTQEKAYWLGFLYADGYNNEKEGIVSLTQCKKHIQILHDFQKFLKTNSPVRLNAEAKENVIINGALSNRQESYKLSVTSKQLSQNLSKHGCGQNKTFTIQFPNISQLYIRHFVRGYFDGDGSVSGTNLAGCRFNMIGTLSVLEGVQQDIEKVLGLPKTKISPARKNSKVYQLIYGGIGRLQKFYDYLYTDAEIYLDVKKEKFESILKLYNDRDENKLLIGQEKQKEVIDLYLDGNSFRKIEKLTNISRGTFRHWITKEIKNQASQRRKELIVGLINDGLSVKQIEQKLHIARATIYSIINN